ncbi:MAG: Glycosyltransferase AglE [Candidatus Woesearchaeota archaeon]|nr:Glycosyltransferase AglE [Candidatus Woesearchaeota archaeon]
MKELVSVIIPAYNEEKYIHRSLGSLKNQTLQDFEVIVVADSCTDKTEEIARKYGAKVISVNTRNNGKNRNIGAKHAKADILVFLDADVRLSKNYLKEAYLAISKGYNCGRPYYYFEDENLISKHRLYLVNKLKIAQFPHTWFVTRKLFFSSGGYSTNLGNCGEEWEIALSVRKQAKCEVVNATAHNSNRRAQKMGVAKDLLNTAFTAARYAVGYRLLNNNPPNWPDFR